MSFWRKLNKTLNNVGSAVGSIAANSGLPGFSQAGSVLTGVIQAGQGNSLPNDIGIVGTGGYEVTVPAKSNDNTLLYIGIGVLAFMLLKKK